MAIWRSPSHSVHFAFIFVDNKELHPPPPQKKKKKKKGFYAIPDSKVHGANMGPIWGRQDPGGPHVGPMNYQGSLMSVWTNI